MVRFYWYGLTVIYVACCAVGLAAGLAWGPAGAGLGIAVGAMAATGISTVLNTSEKMETALYGVLSVGFMVLLAWLLVSFWG